MTHCVEWWQRVSRVRAIEGRFCTGAMRACLLARLTRAAGLPLVRLVSWRVEPTIDASASSSECIAMAAVGTFPVSAVSWWRGKCNYHKSHSSPAINVLSQLRSFTALLGRLSTGHWLLSCHSPWQSKVDTNEGSINQSFK